MTPGRWIAVVVLLAAAVPLAVSPPASAPGSFVFTAAGDHAFGSEFNAGLSRLAAAGADFHLALGDFRYGSGNETTWCGAFKAQVNDVEIVAGNHDVENASEGDINAFAAECPYTLAGPLNGTYAREYWFDYPLATPLVRFILISPGLNFSIDGSGVYDYAAGTPRYNWTRDAIDDSRTAGIPWVVVGMHYQCFASVSGCPMGLPLWNLLVDRKVDLILQAHAHVYERSHQLALNATTCPAMVRNVYDVDCVIDDGADGVYPKGYGAVAVIDGTFGAGLASVNSSDLEAPYFVTSMGNNTAGSGFGFTKYTVSEDAILVETNLSGTFQDSFRIEVPPIPPGPLGVDASIQGPDVNVTWLPSSPDSAVDHYEVWRGTSYSPARLGYVVASPDVPRGTTWWLDAGAGNATADYFYALRAVEPYGGSAFGPGQAAKLRRDLPLAGHQLLSVPFADDTSPEDAFQGLTWNWARAWGTNGALWVSSFPSQGGDLRELHPSTGVWVDVLGPQEFRAAGHVPCTVPVVLRLGWNLAGFPGMGAQGMGSAMAGLQGPLQVEGYDPGAAPYLLRSLGPGDQLEPLSAYWIQSPTDQTWIVVNDGGPGCT